MAAEILTPPELSPPQTPGDRPVASGRAPASAGRVAVSMLICLGLWAVLFAPVLERGAEAGPVGTRRSAALAVLRPLVALSDALSVSPVTEGVERALGRDPDDQPGGELELPDLVLPSETSRPTPRTSSPPPSSPSPSASPTADPTPEPSPAAATFRVPTQGNKLRVAVIGDSLSQGLGPEIGRWVDTELVRALSLGRQSTGLARQDYFNWQAGMRKIVNEFRPDLVIVMLGSNDNQAQVAPDGTAVSVGSLAWVSAYRERAAAFLRTATNAGTHVVWVGIPIVEERARWEFYRRVNGIYESTAEEDPMATFVDTWGLFRKKDGSYTAYVRNERGQLQLMRAPDGIHFTPTGYAYLARSALRAAVEAFGLSPETLTFRA